MFPFPIISIPIPMSPNTHIMYIVYLSQSISVWPTSTSPFPIISIPIPMSHNTHIMYIVYLSQSISAWPTSTSLFPAAPTTITTPTWSSSSTSPNAHRFRYVLGLKYYWRLWEMESIYTSYEGPTPGNHNGRKLEGSHSIFWEIYRKKGGTFFLCHSRRAISQITM